MHATHPPPQSLQCPVDYEEQCEALEEDGRVHAVLNRNKRACGVVWMHGGVPAFFGLLVAFLHANRQKLHHITSHPRTDRPQRTNGQPMPPPKTVNMTAIRAPKAPPGNVSSAGRALLAAGEGATAAPAAAAGGAAGAGAARYQTAAVVDEEEERE
jgi:hypothetical protein